LAFWAIVNVIRCLLTCFHNTYQYGFDDICRVTGRLQDENIPLIVIFQVAWGRGMLWIVLCYRRHSEVLIFSELGLPTVYINHINYTDKTSHQSYFTCRWLQQSILTFPACEIFPYQSRECLGNGQNMQMITVSDHLLDALSNKLRVCHIFPSPSR